MRILIPAAAAVLLLAAAAPGQTFGTRTTLGLPTAAGTDADHATVAVSARGDLFIAWQTDRPDLGTGIKQVEGIFLERVGAQGWRTPDPAAVLVLGDPSLDLLGAGGETCRKPDVAAVGGSFVVAWPRNVPGGGTGRVEAVQILRVPGGGAMVAAPAPGAGYVVDPAVLSGDAGMMPDVVEISRAPELAGIAYVHETLNAGGLREYELRFALIDFSPVGPAVTGPSVVAAGIPLDDSPATGAPGGGLVLPDAVEDDFGHVVLAYEEYQAAGHGGAAQTEGRIQVRRYQESAGVLSLLDGHTFLATHTFGDPPDPANRMRRPNLAASRLDNKNTVSAAFMEIENAPSPDVDVRHWDLNFQGGPAAGPVAPTDLGFTNNQRRTELPVPVHARLMRVALAVHNFPALDKIMASAPLQFAGVRPMPAPFTDTPSRPAADVWELAPAGSPGSRVIPVVYEGLPSAGGPRTIFLVVHRL